MIISSPMSCSNFTLQDKEYLISLLADKDKEKEMNALRKAESHSLKEEESCRSKLEEEVIYFLLLAFLSDVGGNGIIFCKSVYSFIL